MRVGFGQDTHRLTEGRPLRLGGVLIPHAFGLAGHSDADVVLHAIADSMLGAAGLGDIGELYPDTDPKFRNLDSAQLLREVADLVRNAGWQPRNMDIVIHAEQPKLTPFKDAMRKRIAEILELPPTAVNVKAKTGEGVGPIGRGEAMSCEAVTLLTSTEYD